MSRSEFRWNKKRRHYSYLFRDLGTKRFNILITSKQVTKRKGKIVVTNIPLFRHPNIKKKGRFYIIPRRYLDEIESFDVLIYSDWFFDKNDKRKVKRLKRR